MRNAMSGAVAALLLAVPLIEATPAAAQKRGKGPTSVIARATSIASAAGAKAYVDRIYRDLPRSPDWRQTRFAPELKGLLDRERREAAGELGMLYANPFCGCQDTVGEYRFTSNVAATGSGKATATVRVHNGATQNGTPTFTEYRIDLVQNGGVWAVADIHTDVTPSLVAYLRQNLTAEAGAARARALATLPDEWGYKGLLVKADSTPGSPIGLFLENHDGTLVGNYFDYTLGVTTTEALTGTYTNGECRLTVKGGLLTREKRLVGKCDRNSFVGQLTGKKGEFRNNFSLRGIDVAANRQRQARQAAQQVAQRSAPPMLQGYAGSALPSGLPDAAYGFLDYIDGEPTGPTMGNGMSRGRDMDAGGLPAPPGTIWAYGRSRWVVAPGGGCGQETQLLRGYCFDAVIGWLQENPKAKSVNAIGLAQPVPLGTWISNDTPVRYFDVEVSRAGEGFTAKRHLTGTIKVTNPNPMTCSGIHLKDGFVLTDPGPQGLTEAALFQCQQ